MRRNTLREGVVKVRHPQRKTPFMLSVVENTGLIAVRGFEIGDNRPARGKHLTFRNEAVRLWIDELKECADGVDPSLA